jgi:hypothetical protein
MANGVVRRLGRDNPYYGTGTPRITRLFALVGEMNVRTLPKSLRLGTLVEWVVQELRDLAPVDGRTQAALDLAIVLSERARD